MSASKTRDPSHPNEPNRVDTASAHGRDPAKGRELLVESLPNRLNGSYISLSEIHTRFSVPGFKEWHRDSTSKQRMNDSNTRDVLDRKHSKDREQRLEAIKRWVAYIKSEPPETWGPQQNAVVNGQLEAAQTVNVSASHRKHVKDVATEIIAERDSSNDDE